MFKSGSKNSEELVVFPFQILDDVRCNLDGGQYGVRIVFVNMNQT